MSEQSTRAKASNPEEKRLLLAKLLKEKAQREKSFYPLSYSQQSLWFLYRLAPTSVAYNVAFTVRICSMININALQDAFQELVNRHATLRTTFAEGPDGPMQVIHGSREVVLEEINASQWDEDALRNQIINTYKLPFDLEHGPLFRAYLFTKSPSDHILLITAHHTVIDGWSIWVMVDELRLLYSAANTGTKASLPPLEWSYVDYVKWQNKMLAGPEGQRLWEYWQQYLSGELPVLNLSTNVPRPATQTYNGASCVFEFAPKLAQQIKDLGQTEGATPYMTMLSAFQVLLHRYTQNEDILIGSPMTDRSRPEFASIIGDFVNMVPIRGNVSANMSFRTFLRQTRGNVLNMIQHQGYPFSLLINRLDLKRDISSSPLFQVVFDLQRLQRSEKLAALLSPEATHTRVQFGDWDLEPYQIAQQEGQFDLTLQMVETENSLAGVFKYNTDLFEADTIQRMADHFRNLIESIVANPEERISELAILDETEKQKLLLDWKHTQIDFPSDKCIHELFEEQAAKHPDAVAVVFEQQQLTYQQLNARANQLAHYLITHRQVQPDTLVGICLERSLEMVIAILGILKAGGAYVPLDPEYPQARLAYMLSDAHLATVLTHSSLLERLPVTADQALCWDDASLQQVLATQSQTDPSPQQLGLRPHHLAYLIYTSGSTGNPKGVQAPHLSICNRLNWLERNFPISVADVFCQKTAFSFVDHVAEIFQALAYGKPLILVRTSDVLDPFRFAQIIRQHQITRLTLVPSLLKYLIENNILASMTSLRLVITSGEALQLAEARNFYRALPHAKLLNLYGSSEVGADVTAYWVDNPDKLNSIPIGQAIDNIQLLVCDAQLQLVPQGVPGELLIGGVGLARGYLNRPELTAEKFIPNPFYDRNDPNSSARLYKTGDLVRWMPDGDIEYLGRIDHQVKIRGFRIELDEVEHTLRVHDRIKDAVVLAKETATGEKHLVAYVVAKSAGEINFPSDTHFIEQLRQHLSQTLPDYMVPSAFMVLEKLPLTPNGKVDRKALPDPDLASQQAIYVAPRTEIENILCEIWQDVLGLERVGITDNFFQLGGHSLLATRLVSRINQHFHIDLPLKSIFAEPVVEQLAQAILRLKAGTDRPALVRVSREGKLLPSYAQQRLWFLDQIDGGSAHYNLSGALKLSGELNYQALNRAFTTIFNRHESLRTCFAVDEDGQPYQHIQSPTEFSVAIQDVSHLTDTARELAIAEIVNREAHRVFDLSSDLMLRAHLLKVSAAEHILIVTMHHIASDGWSMPILTKEFSALYSAYDHGQEDPLLPLQIQYADYAYWQRGWLQGEVLQRQLAYWEQQLAGLPMTHSLPLDHPRPQVQRFEGNSFISEIDAKTTHDLNTLCRANGATLFMGLHAAFSTLLARHSNELDIVIGSPIANREQAEIAGLIGFFANTLVLRCDLSNTPSFIELLDHSKRMLLDAYAHQQVPFELVVERLQPERSLSHSPLFQIMLTLQNNEQATLTLPRLTLSTVENNSAILSKFELTLYVTETSTGLSLNWEYNTDLFEASTIERMSNHFTTLLKSLLNAPNENVFTADMLSAAERYQVLAEWNDTAADYPREKCIHELFEEQAARHPDAIAVVFEQQQLTYQQLNARANQLAHYLITHRQVQPDTLVGICLERSLEMVIAILGILKAGGAYVPLDPEYPQARLAYMLSDAHLATVLTHSSLLERLPVTADQALCWDDASLQHELATQSPTDLSPQQLGLRPHHLAYLIYTSGSTGNPKGVMVEHTSLVNRIHWMDHQYGSSSSDRILQKTPFSFDVSVWEFVWPLTVGARLVFAKPGGHKDPMYLTELIRAQGITKLHFVPSMLGSMLSLGDLSKCDSLKQVFCSGEALPLNHVKEFFRLCPNVELHNLYGPTEAAIDVSYWDCSQVDDKLTSVPIGRAIDNIQLLVCNSQLQLVPQGVAGELLIGGIGLARGYLNRPELTDEKFIANPFYDSADPNSSKRLYKTGDLVRWMPDGDIEYLGRIDHQVKIRGFRIELGEIENALSKYDGIKDTVVLAKELTSGDKYLVAYVVTESSKETSIPTNAILIEQLCQHLSQTLPDYMVPSAFMVLEKLPLTPNGKVDRKALPDPELSSQQAIYVAPRDEVEEGIAMIMADLLKLEKVGVNDNFFHIGGHSLLATQVISRIQQSFNIAIPLRTMFEAPTVAELALIVLEKKLQQLESDQALELLAGVENLPEPSDHSPTHDHDLI